MKALAWAMGLVFAGMIGCSGDEQPTGSTSTSGMSSSGSSDSSSSSSSSSSGGGTIGRCLAGCTTAADCCVAGQIDCPNGPYPNNPTCTVGYCLEPQCASAADCTQLGANFDCLSTLGLNSCGVTCAQNEDCPMNTQCTGVDANGKKFCRSMGAGQECLMDADCDGRGTCVNKYCRCASAVDCTHPIYNKCIP